MPGRIATWSMLLLVAVALAPRTASALAVTITYSVGSGWAEGPHLPSSFIIPGGTVSVTHPNANSLYSAPPTTRWTLNSLRFTTGYGGTFSLRAPLHVAGAATITPLRDQFWGANLPMLAYSGGVPVSSNVTVFVNKWGPIPPSGDAAIRATVPYGTVTPMFSHGLSFSAEISRVPEPGAFAQLAVGMVGLAALTAAARWRRRRGWTPKCQCDTPRNP
jgi:hypothetical protein